MRQKYPRISRRFFLFRLLQVLGKPFYYLSASVVFGIWIWTFLLKKKFTGLQARVKTHFFLELLFQTRVPTSTKPTGIFYRQKFWLKRFFKKVAQTVHTIFLPFHWLIKGFTWLFRPITVFFFHTKWGASLITFMATITVISITAWFVYEYIFQDLPSPLEVSQKERILTTRIYDRHGQELYNIYKDENRTLVPLSDLPQHVINSTIAIEDSHFFQHPGFSLKGIMRAVKVNFTEGKMHGGSTITQQLVKNVLLNSEKKYQRKLREVLLAIAVDALYSKEEILSMYFNQISYGGTIYGIEQASLKYFGKHSHDLTLAEAALLAGIPASPTAYSPFGNTPELAFQRQQEVIRRMAEERFITAEQAEQALAEKIVLKENKTDIKAPHFVMYVRSLLAEKYGEGLLTQGGLEIYTSLDLGLQNQVQQLVSDEIFQLRHFHISNGAALVTQPKTGEILAMVGSVNYFDFEHGGQVNLTERLRQPGSSIKPLTYAVALENGMTPATTIVDAPVTYTVPGSKPYSPQNYDGKFHGVVRLREALANSYNIPAVKTLEAIGLDAMINKGKQMGIDTWNDRSRYGLSLTLGGGEVRMTDMAELYGTFANMGQTVELNPLLLVKDAEGKILYENECIKDQNRCNSRRTLDPSVAFQITDILSDNQARSSAFGLNSVLNIPNQQVAVKTGTTNSLRDNWTIGYTSDRVVSVWVGNNDNTPMSYVASGITGASPIWNKIIRTQLSEENPHAFTAPSPLVKLAICTTTGTLSCQGCPSTKEEYFIPGTEPTQRCVADQFQQEHPNRRSRNQIGL